MAVHVVKKYDSTNTLPSGDLVVQEAQSPYFTRGKTWIVWELGDSNTIDSESALNKMLGLFNSKINAIRFANMMDIVFEDDEAVIKLSEALAKVFGKDFLSDE